MRVLVTGGCGFVGHVLAESLIKLGHSVCIVDIMWFGSFHKPNPRLEIVQADIRSYNWELEEYDAIIHLAGIANDPSAALNPNLSWETNVYATYRLAEAASRARVKLFVFASSGSVYGVSESPKVDENSKLNPISLYNKTKMLAERVTLSFSDKMKVINVRPATICGWSPRMRLDLAVNLLTFQALNSGRMTVFGGNQYRPNIHIMDMINLYQYILDNSDFFESGNYNAGFENLTIKEIANKVSKIIGGELTVTESNDPRSYRLDSSKLLGKGFSPQFGVDDAIDEIRIKFLSGELTDSSAWHSVQRLKDLGVL